MTTNDTEVITIARAAKRIVEDFELNNAEDVRAKIATSLEVLHQAKSKIARCHYQRGSYGFARTWLMLFATLATFYYAVGQADLWNVASWAIAAVASHWLYVGYCNRLATYSTEEELATATIFLLQQELNKQ